MTDKGCEFCGLKENCNNYKLGKSDMIKEVEKIFTKLSDENGSWGDFERKFKKAIKDLKEVKK
jgi:hypothetical protein